MAELYYHPLFFFVWGACWGSFFNVVLYRYPRGLSVVHPGSACPHCARAIKPWDNIPIVSWLLLAGKCRHCKARISPTYLLNEAFFGIVSALPIWAYPTAPGLGLPLSIAVMTLLPTAYLLVRYRRAPWYLIAACSAASAFYLFNILSR